MAQMDIELGIDPSSSDLDAIMRSLEQDLSDCDDSEMPGHQEAQGNDPKTTPRESTSDSSSSESTSGKVGPVTRNRVGREYNLRSSSLINRLQTEQRQASPRKPKAKAKPPPLSKYRRRTANSRERNRMREINDAFDVLRQAIPDYQETGEGSKMTKITTLRLALNYISALRGMLGYEEDMCVDGGSSPDSHTSGHMVSPSHSELSSDGQLSPRLLDSEGEHLSPHTSLLDSEGESVHS